MKNKICFIFKQKIFRWRKNGFLLVAQTILEIIQNRLCAEKESKKKARRKQRFRWRKRNIKDFLNQKIKIQTEKKKGIVTVLSLEMKLQLYHDRHTN